MEKKKRATGKEKSISHPRIKEKREMTEEEVESRGVCCKRERRGSGEREKQRRREDWREKPEKKRG